MENLIVQSINGKGILTLNRPAVLNAFTLEMNRKITLATEEWQNSKKDFVIITSNGQHYSDWTKSQFFQDGPGSSFCAGGDLKELIILDGEDQKRYFEMGYTYTDFIDNYRIPYISLINGIAFGGGIGLSIYGSHRVATEKCSFAMPEVFVGFFPDVGASYFLPRLFGGNRQIGLFLALTGYRLNATDAWHAGIVTHHCSSDMVKSLESDLINLTSCGSTDDIDKVLQKYHDLCPNLRKIPCQLDEHLEQIDRIFCGDSVEEIVGKLEDEAKNCEWASSILKKLQKASPTSLKVTWKLQKLGEGQSLRECLRNEFKVVQNICKTSDFIQGVTAVVIDKNKKPQWNPATLEEISESYLDSLFECQPHHQHLEFY